MVVRTIEMLLEFIGIVICICRILRKRECFNIWILILGGIDLGIGLGVAAEILKPWCKIFVHISIICYLKKRMVRQISEAIGVYGCAILCLIIMQIICYYFFKIVGLGIEVIGYAAILSNILIIIALIFFKEKYIKVIWKSIYDKKSMIISILFLVILLRFFYLCYINGYVNLEMALQFWVCMLGLIVVVAFWTHAEMNNQHKMKELKMYELYNQAFEETITTIRARQHEFENHINAIKCMQYTIGSREQLLFAQEQYCNMVLEECSLSKLLKLKMEPALVGFLYAKMTKMKEKGILVEYDISPIDIRGRIEVYEMIELIGIFLDNALEALEESDFRKVLIEILNDKNGFIVEIANTSRIYTNVEMEQFFSYGYSTKGTGRGCGLNRVKEIVKKANAELLIQNRSIDTQNYLCFSVCFYRN